MAFVLTPRMNTPTRTEEHSCTPEGKSPRRLQRPGVENRAPPSSFDLSSRPSLENNKPMLPDRRRSLARTEYKPPLGPRPLETSTAASSSSSSTKRVASDVAKIPPPRSFLPTTASEPFLGLSGRRSASISRSGVRQDVDPVSTVPPPSRTPVTAEFELPRRSTERLPRLSSSSQSLLPSARSSMEFGAAAGTARNTPMSQPDSISATNRNAALRAAQISASHADGSLSSTALNVKTRRQSHFPTAAAPVVESRAPRKSIGPGLIVTNAHEREKQAKPVAVDKPPPTGPPSRRASNASSKPRVISGPTTVPQATIERLARPKRDVKAQSMQPPPRIPPPPVPPPSNSQKADESNLIGRSPARPSLWRTNTPTAASKRQSTINGRMSGLGARTVSPTDAHRAKRVSTMPAPPPMPLRSSLTPDPMLAPSPAPQSRQLRSVTPGSARATPEAVRHSIGRVSSRSSYSSLRPLSSSLQSGSGSGSKGLGERSSTALNTEIVPPVPKIPTAYESPSEHKDQPFFGDLVASMTSQDRAAATKDVDSGAASSHNHHSEPFSKLLDALAPKSSSAALPARRQSAIPNRQDSSGITSSQHTRQFSNAPRLPPLNLLPLSDPSLTAKMASFSQSRHQRQTSSSTKTPPPKRNQAKTPSTPMTASKATFTSQDFGAEFDFDSFNQLRSTTSYGLGRPQSPPQKSSGGSPDTFKSFSPETPRAVDKVSLAPTPAQEDVSMAKSDTNQARSRAMSKSSVDERQSSRLLGRRSRAASKAGRDAPAAPTELEIPSQTQGSSIRRKLSMAWRRDSPKSSTQTHKQDDVSGRDAAASLQMPPPKIPASALGPSRPTSKALNTPVTPAEARATPSQSAAVKAVDKPAAASTGAMSTKMSISQSTNSFFSPMQKMLSGRASNGAMNRAPALDTSRLDQDDLQAEQEMKKLAGKRKDFEASARELDELHKKAAPKDRTSPSRAAKSSSLNIFERGEVIDYKDVYFTGTRHAKKFVGDMSAQATNFGFDDDRGDYNIVLGDHLAYRYEVVDMLGKGSFGQVVRCIDHKNGKLVAIKIIRNKKRFHQQALVEVNILQRLREWDPRGKHSMISFTQSFYFRGHLCISTELLGMNLYEFIKAHDFRGFSLKLIRRFTKQMLASLCLLQTKKVIHCDLKPENILLAHPLHSEIKVIDFGSSCLENEKVYTYIQSRFYRSPEVILGMNYGMPIDMWSLGCILAELLTGYPIFPGENEGEQLACIMEVFGPPEKHLIERATRRKLFFDSLGKPRVTISSKGKRRRPSSKTLQQALKCDDEAFLDFISRCLRWDPDRRMKPDEAAGHEFVTGVKKGSRPQRQQRGGLPERASSPSKKNNTVPAPSRERATSSVNAAAKLSTPNLLSTSPTKPLSGTGARRQSAFPTAPPVSKRMSSVGAMGSSGLPRASNSSRSFSGKPDLASAAAIASLRAGGQQ